MQITNVLRTLAATALIAGAALTAQAQVTVTQTNSVAGIFDNSSGTRLFTFNSADLGAGGAISDVNISVTFDKADGEGWDLLGGTPYLNEVNLTLSYLGNTTSLIAGGSFNSGSALFSGTITFDDDAAQVVNVNQSLIQAGAFRPTGSLAIFNSLMMAPGDWTLLVEDTVGADALRFHSATLEVTYGSPVPEPSTYGLIGAAALLGLVAVRRFKSKKA
ncbi:hypothetical protein DB347_21235 [Opitutaceae bacterium EW11]|nr:hypothetical protein DB347_21235 [Opitutaceae bacterium EW11]